MPPTAFDHYEWARSNEGFYRELGAENSGRPDWSMTVLFYAAVHYVQAGCVHLGHRPLPRTHEARKDAIRTLFNEISDTYETLYANSRRARYECIKHRKHDLSFAHLGVQSIAAGVAKKADPSGY